MSIVINARDVYLQTEARTNPVTLPSGVSVDYSNVLNGPPIDATANYFTQSTSNPVGGTDGAVHYNISTGVMWMKIAGTWTPGGTLNASQITTGTLAASLIAAGSITASKLSIGTLSAITSNLGTVTAGSITGSAGIDITGLARFRGVTNYGGQNYAGVFNESLNCTRGVVGIAPAGASNIGVNGSLSGATSGGYGVNGTVLNPSGIGVQGYATGSSGIGVVGWASGSGGIGVTAQVTSPATTALSVVGAMSISSSALVTNLNADMLDGKHAASLCSLMVCNVGTANAGGNGFTFSSTVAGTRTTGSGNALNIESTSDIRLKKDINPERLGLDFIRKLKPVTYRMIEDRFNPNVLYHGFIAQDMDGLIRLEDDDCLYRLNSAGFYGVDYAALSAPIVKAIQEFNEKLEVINIRLSKLEGQA